MSLAHRRADRRELRARARSRRRGGPGRGPLVVQRAVGRVRGAVDLVTAAIRRAVRGDRPLLVALVGCLVVSVLILSQPAQSYLDGRERVDTLEAKADALETANTDLDRRAEDLQDPDTIELLARESQGFIRPGEVPYAIVAPEVERPQITNPRDAAPEESDAWYRRAWDLVVDRLS
ncbi:MAG: septum formation initiator family protein [Nitriliruptoraceae bacterium]|nr:septum formation initiator family protein [Nitriliruptoraceae bacterium]